MEARGLGWLELARPGFRVRNIENRKVFIVRVCQFSLAIRCEL